GRHRGRSRRSHRRLRPGESAQSPWTDLARIDRARAQRASLPSPCRHPPHGGAFRLCATALLAAFTVGNDGRDGADLSRASLGGYFRQRRGAVGRGWGVGAGVSRLFAHDTIFPVVAGFGARAACYFFSVAVIFFEVLVLPPRLGP